VSHMVIRRYKVEPGNVAEVVRRAELISGAPEVTTGEILAGA